MAELAQHITVGVVALAALGIIVRRVTGTFTDKPSSSPATPAQPACSHCAAGHAASRKTR